MRGRFRGTPAESGFEMAHGRLTRGDGSRLAATMQLDAPFPSPRPSPLGRGRNIRLFLENSRFGDNRQRKTRATSCLAELRPPSP